MTLSKADLFHDHMAQRKHLEPHTDGMVAVCSWQIDLGGARFK
ncbi:MAG: hypothetical protein OTJ45_00710 [Alphaproteobacteria bacterium]|nr:hypothetical protein [Alphaproteobacteria bacterium]